MLPCWEPLCIADKAPYRAVLPHRMAAWSCNDHLADFVRTHENPIEVTYVRDKDV